MSQRINTKNFVGKWQFAGGKLEEGENPILGGVREVIEETGLTIDRNRFHYITSILEDPTTEACYAYVVYLNETEVPQLTEPDKMTEWKLLTLEEALTLDLMPGLRTIIKELRYTI